MKVSALQLLIKTWSRYCDNGVDYLLVVVFSVIADWDVDESFILLVVGDNGHVIFLVDVTGNVVFPVFTVNGNVVFLVVEVNEDVALLVVDVTGDVIFFVDDITGYLVFPVGDAVYDLRVVVPDGILHNTTTSPPLPPGNQQFKR